MYHSLKANLLILGFLGFNLVAIAGDAQTHVHQNKSPRYKINFKLPAEWQLTNKDPITNAMSYQPNVTKKIEDNQIINIIYRPAKTSLRASAQTLLDSIAEYTCKHKDTKILAEDKNSITFTMILDNCTNVPVPSSHQISKIFNASDGQYMILYIADPRLETTIKKMKDVIQSSTIIPISG